MGEEAVVAARMAILARADTRREQLLDVVVSAIFEALPEYVRGRSVAELDDIRTGIARSIELCLRTVADGLALRPEEYTALRLTGGQRARQGISKAVVFDSVKIATRAGLAFIMTCGESDADPETLTAALSGMAQLIGRFEDDACKALGEGHDEATARLFSGGDRGEAVLVDRLLEKRFSDEEEVLRHAAHVGLSSTRAAYVVVGTPCQSTIDDDALRKATGDLRSRVVLATGPVRSDVRIHLPLVVQPRNLSEWQVVLEELESLASRHVLTFVHADRSVGLTSVSDVYRSIRDGLRFVPAVTGRAGVVRSVLVQFHRAICSGNANDRLVLLHEVLGPLYDLPERERSELLSTLDALYESGGSPAGLARHLHVHKNTIGNRLRRVSELTGLDMRRPAERLVLETVLRMRQVAEGEGPGVL